jgi:hypothetical protein
METTSNKDDKEEFYKGNTWNTFLLIPGTLVSVPGVRSNLKGGYFYKARMQNRKDYFGNEIQAQGSHKISFNEEVKIIPIKTRRQLKKDRREYLRKYGIKKCCVVF